MGATASPAPSVTSGEPLVSTSKGLTEDASSIVADALIRYGVAASGDVSRCRIGRGLLDDRVWATMTRGKPKPRDRARSRGCCGARAGESARLGWTLASLTRAFAARSPSPVYAVLCAARAAAPVVVSPCWAAVNSLVRMLLAWSTVSGAEAALAFGGSWMPRIAGAAAHPAMDAPPTILTTHRAMARTLRLMQLPPMSWSGAHRADLPRTALPQVTERERGNDGPDHGRGKRLEEPGPIGPGQGHRDVLQGSGITGGDHRRLGSPSLADHQLCRTRSLGEEPPHICGGDVGQVAGS